MKTWNITSAKFYSEIMNGLSAFFGLEADDATEAELHQKIVEAGTLENIRAAALNEANAAVQSQMADFQSQLDALQSKMTALYDEVEEKAEKIEGLESDLKMMLEDVTAKNTEIEGLKKQNEGLSGQVASLKAGKPTEKNTPPDASKEMPKETTPKGGQVVSSDELQKAFAGLGKQKMN